MARQALFEGLVYDENGHPVTTAHIGDEAHYVVEVDGFHRHIASEEVDRQILAVFIEQLQANQDMAVQQALNFIGRDDLFTKAALDASIRNVSPDQILEQGIPPQARDMMGMAGFQVIINHHGEIVGMNQPTAPDEE
jgi:hypothetical protein